MANPQKLQATVKDIVAYGRQVYRVDFELEKKFPRYKPGQFLHLTLDAFDPTSGFWPESRVFSIAGGSDDRKEITIVYSVKGSYTGRMERELEIGHKVWLKAPYGEFIIPNYLQDEDTAVLIAGGTGISPFIPFLDHGESSNDVKLFYGVKSAELIIFNEQIEKANNNPKVDVSLFFEESEEDKAFKEKYSTFTGMLSVPKILEKATRANTNGSYVFFISGPPGMIESFKGELIEDGIVPDRIITDEWS